MSRVVVVVEPVALRAVRPQEDLWIRAAARAGFTGEQEDFEERVASLRARVSAGEPLQYVLGDWQFRELNLRVGPGVLIPRFETELIVDLVIKACGGVNEPRIADLGDSKEPVADAEGNEPRIADLGTGSGAIALAVAKEIVTAHVVATDMSDEALRVAVDNGVRNDLTERVAWRRGNWYDALSGDQPFDVVVSNPPYVSEREWEQLELVIRDWEPVQALVAGADGLKDLRVIVRGAPTVLKKGGTLVVEIGANQGPRVAELFSEAGLVDVQVVKDLCSRDRFVLGRVDACL